MYNPQLLERLLEAYHSSPHPSYKVTNYFPIYVELFGHLVDQPCTFVETGILNGGSLFMWRSWLGPQAKIVGVDLNPAAKKWEEHGFEIHIGDQGDPKFWQESLKHIGPFDAFLDDGGHQTFQQIVTLTEAMRYMKPHSVIAIEDTVASHMKDFSDHMSRSFLEYAKDATDLFSARNADLWPKQYPKLRNQKIIDYFSRLYNISFYTGIVAFKANPSFNIKPELIWNKKPKKSEHDFRRDGLTKSANVLWPDPFSEAWVKINGQD
jgi:cephalosporin hydroxylase